MNTIFTDNTTSIVIKKSVLPIITKFLFDEAYYSTEFNVLYGVLRNTNSFLGGSFVRCLFRNSNGVPGDIDVFAKTHHEFDNIVSIFVKLGATIVNTHPLVTELSYPKINIGNIHVSKVFADAEHPMLTFMSVVDSAPSGWVFDFSENRLYAPVQDSSSVLVWNPNIVGSVVTPERVDRIKKLVSKGWRFFSVNGVMHTIVTEQDMDNFYKTILSLKQPDTLTITYFMYEISDEM